MSSRAIYDSVGEYRERTRRMSNSPSSTFSCGFCKQFCSILGRRLVAQDGNRKTYACANCSEGK